MELKSWICLFCFITVYVGIEGNVWTQKKKSHKAKSLTTAKMERLADKTSEVEFKKYLKPMLRTRVPGTEGHKVARQHIIDTMKGFGWDIEEDTFSDMTPFGEKPFVNIIATHNPEAERRLTLACHYDSKYFKNFEFIGATDSAVPCAMLLDLARTLVVPLDNQKKSLGRDLTLQFIFFDGEEAFKRWTSTDSIYGARHLAEKLEKKQSQVDREMMVNELERMDALVLLDLIGTPNNKFRNWFQSTEKLFERLKKIEQRLVQRDRLKLPTGSYFVGNLVRGSGGIEDDHIPFLRKDVPVLHLISYPFPDVWHTEADNAASLDYRVIDDINKIVRVFVAEYLHLSP